MKKILKSRFVISACFIIIVFACSCKCACLLQSPKACDPPSAYAQQLTATDHFLDSVTARAWIERYISKKDSICTNAVGSNTNVLPDSSQSFNRKFIQQILCLKDCIGIRIYCGMDEQDRVHFILGGIDPCGNTLYITDNNPSSPTAGQKGLAEMGQKP